MGAQERVQALCPFMHDLCCAILAISPLAFLFTYTAAVSDGYRRTLCLLLLDKHAGNPTHPLSCARARV